MEYVLVILLIISVILNLYFYLLFVLFEKETKYYKIQNEKLLSDYKELSNRFDNVVGWHEKYVELSNSETALYKQKIKNLEERLENAKEQKA